MQQSTALQLLKSGKSIFLTGSAGTGKTYVLNQYIQYLRKRNISVAITASTGIAATHLNGQTIHAWSGIGIKSHLTAGKISLLLSKKKFKEQLQRTQVLIIDEISMLHKDQLQLIHQILQAAKSSEHPFGGMQVIFSGDFFQLPPIGNYGETNKDKFAFMSPVWIEAIKTNRLSVCYLTQQYRQEDNSLNQLLDEIRQGAISPESKAILKEVQANSVLGKNEIPKLYSHNSDVSIINNKMLNELPGSKIPFVARTKGKKGAVEFLKKSANVAPELFLKKGAKVMFVKNNSEKGYANGTLGEVERFNLDGAPVVLLKSGRRITPEREKWSIEDDTGHEDATLHQYPLRLAWAVTVHKSQGMTLEAAEIDLSKTFERGQGYVALSRLKSMDGLQLKGINGVALEVDSLAKKIDFRFRQLSAKAEQLADEATLEEQARRFIKHCGGISDPDEMKRHEQRRKEKKMPKRSTYEITRELIDKGWDIDQIATERGLKGGTIISHVVKIHEMYPDVNIHQFRPKGSLISKVQKMMAKIEKNNNPEHFNSDGKIQSSVLFEALGGSISYQELKLAQLFMN